METVRYESIGTDFRREVTIDDDGLVTDYSGAVQLRLHVNASVVERRLAAVGLASFRRNLFGAADTAHQRRVGGDRPRRGDGGCLGRCGTG